MPTFIRFEANVQPFGEYSNEFYTLTKTVRNTELWIDDFMHFYSELIDELADFEAEANPTATVIGVYIKNFIVEEIPLYSITIDESGNIILKNLIRG